ncbi:FAD-dependent monooxygenase [Hyphodiscus hymeniophilus]|uniref:FAD-dependent monooxygenase n=1 Tax=Hyphodiscus hymeniophilus TaxID=353542 RepID=A0A9P6VEZ4_9HELO|nr:FAD-dependent monooxygenase [Hyphodiscus hymeniophilus]
MATSSRKPILISGGGLSALLLGKALLRASIPFLLFERDASISFRAQGYRLRLSAGGLDAIEGVLGPEGFQKFWDICGKTGGVGLAVVNAVTGETIEQMNPAKDAESEKTEGLPRPREQLGSRDGKIVGISRGDMRKAFMTGCESFIHWSHRVTGYELTSSGVRAIFADGSKSVEGEMLIGGEGIYSKVSKQLSEGKLKTYDTGARAIHGQAPTSAFKGLGEGVWRMIDESKSNGKVFVMTNIRSGDMDNPEVEFGWTMGATPDVIQPPNNDYAIIGKPAADMAKDLIKDWHPRFQPMFQQMVDSESSFWKITCSTPTGVPEWKNEPRVTLIGDAVHAMTPAGGNGANTALKDSALLGRLLAEAGGYKDGVTLAYEKEMRVYASEAVAASYDQAKGMFGFTFDENTKTI